MITWEKREINNKPIKGLEKWRYEEGPTFIIDVRTDQITIDFSRNQITDKKELLKEIMERLKELI